MTFAALELVKTSSVKSAVLFGSPLPKPPYVVIKDERALRGRRIRVITHMLPGQQKFLEDFVREELLVLLDGAVLTSRAGAHNRLEVEDEPGGIVVSNDDGTISMERCFLLPSRQF